MPFDYDDGSTRRPNPGTVAATGQILTDLLVSQRQQEREMRDTRTESRSAGSYAASATHTSGSTSHTFSFSFGSGVWIAQVNATTDTDASAGSFGVSVSGGSPAGTFGPLPLSSAGDSAAIVAVVVNGGDLDVLCAVADLTGGTTYTFEIDVLATRVS